MNKEFSKLLLGEWRSRHCTQYIGLQSCLLVLDDNERNYICHSVFIIRIFWELPSSITLTIKMRDFRYHIKKTQHLIVTGQAGCGMTD